MTLFPVPEDEKPITRFLPKQWLDETVPEAQADPNKFLCQVVGSWHLVDVHGDKTWTIPVEHGDLIEFECHRHYGSRNISVAEDGSYTLSEDFPADSTSFCFDDADWEDMGGSIAECISRQRENGFDAFSPPYETTISAWFWGDTTTFRVVIDEDKARLEKLPEPPLVIPYTNWRGETAIRRLCPIGVKFTSTSYHREPQWILDAFDYDRQEMRGLAMKDFGLSGVCEFILNGGDIDLDKLNALATESQKPGVILRVENDDPMTLLKAALRAEMRASHKENRKPSGWYQTVASAVLGA